MLMAPGSYKRIGQPEYLAKNKIRNIGQPRTGLCCANAYLDVLLAQWVIIPSSAKLKNPESV